MWKRAELRALVTQRLTAAAEDIFLLFEKNIAEYEREVLLLTHNNSQQQRPSSQQHQTTTGVQVVSMIENSAHIKEEPQEKPLEGPELFAPIEDFELDQTEENREETNAYDSDHTDLSEDYGEELDEPKTSHTPFRYPDHVPFSCLECGMMIQGEKNITKHMRTHSHGKAFTCSICASGFDKEIALIQHEKQAHNICPVCSKRCRILASHLKTHIKDGTLQPDSPLLRNMKTPFRCLECRKKFTCKSGLQQHVKIHGQGRHRCRHCGKRFTSGSDLEKHLKVHLVFICEVCEKKFPTNTKLKTHMRIHKKQSFACSVCDKNFRSKSNLSAHMKTHVENKPFACSVCEKSFAGSNEFTRHLEVSHHICPVCCVGFSNGVEVKEHLHSHSESELEVVMKPLSCPVCEKRFRYENTLQVHMVVHSDERPFQCSVCEKRFKRELTLTRHVKMHRINCRFCGIKVNSDLSVHLLHIHHICSVCEEGFTDRAGVAEHLKSHWEEGTLNLSSVQIKRCSECGELFFTQDSLKKHEEEAHGAGSNPPGAS